MSLFKIILDDIELEDEPRELDKIKFQIVRDDVIRGLVLKVTSTLTFYGDGYDYLLERRRNSVCESVRVIIQHRCSDEENFIELFRGTIILSDGESVQFNPIRCECEAEIQDANFGAKIENNKKIKAYVGTPTSKNGVDITAAQVTNITGFNIFDGLPSGTPREAYSVFECFRFLVEFMSDGELKFESDFLSTGEGKNWFVIRGQRIRNNTGDPVYTSFEDLFESIFSEGNISFSIENGDTIRIEPENDLFNDSTAETIDGINDVQEYVDSTRFYDRIVLGSENVNDTGTFPIDFRFVGWNEEEYHLLGECNGGESLSLINNFIIDHNSIEAAILGDDTNDDENFLIWADSVTGNAVPTPRFGLGFFYNITFTNEEKIKRHFGAIPNSIALFLGEPGADDQFRASMSATQQFLGVDSGNTNNNIILPFNDVTPPPDDVFDTDGNFDTANFRYVVPIEGVYNIRARIDIRHEVDVAILKSSQTVRHTVEIERLDSSNVLIGIIGVGSIDTHVSRNAAGTVNNASVQLTVDTGGIPLAFDDRIRVRIKSQLQNQSFDPTTNVFYDTSSRFLTLASQAAFGVMETFDVEDTRSLISEFSHNITREQFLNIIEDTNKKLVISGGNGYHRNGWIEELEYELNSTTRLKIVSNGS